jgi:hypothetical protein
MFFHPVIINNMDIANVDIMNVNVMNMDMMSFPQDASRRPGPLRAPTGARPRRWR